MTQFGFLRHAAFAVVALAPISALASPNLVVNGDFEQTTTVDGTGNPGPAEMNTTNVTGWSTTGYNFIFGANTASTVGSYTPQFQSNLKLYDGSEVAGGAVLGRSPSGGNFVGADGAFEVAPITQTLTGLTAGSNYAVSFSWAGAQQSGFSGPTTEQWIVGLGGQKQSTAVVNNASHGFTGWTRQTFVFEANAASEVLSFLAVGTPDGEPPFSLLDGVSATDVPEPASLVLMLTAIGIAGAAFMAVARRVRNTAA